MGAPAADWSTYMPPVAEALTDGTDRAAQAAVEGRFFPRERHERTTFSNEPAAAAETAGDYLREPVAAGQGQIVEVGGAPRGTNRRHGGAAPRLDAEFPANTQGRSDPAREAASTHRPDEATAEPDRGPSKVGTKSAAHPLPVDDLGCRTCPPPIPPGPADSGSGQGTQGGRGVSEPPAISRAPKHSDDWPELPTSLDRRPKVEG